MEGTNNGDTADPTTINKLPVMICSNVTLLIVDMGPKVMVCSFNSIIINITVVSMVDCSVTQQM
jgi:hypothetical protein